MVSVAPNLLPAENSATNNVNIADISSNDQLYRLCPTCKGKGYVSPVCLATPSSSSSSTQIDMDDISETGSYSNNSLPPKTFFHKESSLPIFPRSSKTPSVRRNVRSNVSLGKLPITAGEKVDDILPSPKKFERPVEAARLAMRKLKDSQWDVLVEGLRDVVQLARFHAEALEPHFKSVNRALVQLLNNLRSHVTRMTCQATGEIFKNIPCVCRPEFDEIIAKLLLRTADMNQFIRKDANDALDKIITYIPPVHTIRTIVLQGSEHKNHVVRSATARLLTCIVLVHGNDVIFKVMSKEGRKRFLNAAAKFLCDADLETRKYTGQLFKAVMTSEDFDDAFHADVPKNYADRIEAKLIMLKFSS